MSRRRITATIAGFALLGSAQAAEHVVQAMPNYIFSPSILGIYPGDTVRFTNAGGFHNVRQVHFNDEFVSPELAFCAPAPDCQPSAESWSSVITLTEIGEYLYWCEVHSGVMRGIIVVKDPGIFGNGFEMS